MKTYPVPQELLQAVLNYLMTRPWREVNEFMAAFAQIAKTADESSKE